MKTILILALSLCTTAVFAAAKCPRGATLVKSCKSTPVSGDQEVASGMLDSIAICSDSGVTYMVAEKNKESEIYEAKVVSRPGGISYSVAANEHIVISLSLAAGTRYPAKKASFSVISKVAGMKATSTYTCK